MPTSARTRSLLTWLPATILLVVIGLVVLATFAVQGSWWAEEKPSASADQKASDGSSVLTDAGFDYVNVEGIVRVRIGDGALPAEELGMGANAEKSAEFRGPVRAVIAGGEDVYVVDDVGGLTAVTRNGELASVTLMFDSPGTWSDAVEQVQSLAPTFGWDENQITQPRRAARGIQPERHRRDLHRGGRSLAGRGTGDCDPVVRPRQRHDPCGADLRARRLRFSEPTTGLEPVTP